MTIDALEYARRLEEAGLERRQAEAIAAGLRDAVVPSLAGKTDLDTAVVTLKGDIARLQGHIDTRIAELRAEVFRLMIGQIPVFGGLAALLRF
jgi:hypothetical protein